MMNSGSNSLAPPPAILEPANTGSFGLLPAAHFRLTTGACTDCSAIPQALWFFRHESIAVPLPGQPLAGFDPKRRASDDVARWHGNVTPGTAHDYPPLVWTGAASVVSGARLSADGSRFHVGTDTLAFKLFPRHPLNRSYFNDRSEAFFSQRTARLRGDWKEGKFVVRALWPEDFCIPESPASNEIAATPQAFRERVRELPRGGAEAPFSVESLWQRPGSGPLSAGRPTLSFILNGAQGDDDEAHGGHFAVAIGNIGAGGAFHDWLVANYYTLDSESEKGIIAAPVPLDNYFADLNAGQSWYRPSCMLVAVLHEPRAAAHIQSALGRAFNQFYRHQFTYQHARSNCAGISVSTLRALDWQVPAAGPESWLKAFAALPVVSLKSGRLKEGKAVFDYLTEDRTRLYPGVAFEQIGADLLRLAKGTTQRKLSAFENALAGDIDALLFVRIPQLPSSRAWGDYPIVSSVEYRERIPKRLEDRQIVPVGPRPFPKDFVDPDAPSEPPLRSDYAVAGIILLVLLALLLPALWLR
ncbi:MAG: hypothetical protein QG619_1943 [Pseudomonadota bacterium]|nr:hypothetical protein [Pseudomonadota bacterium]